MDIGIQHGKTDFKMKKILYIVISFITFSAYAQMPQFTQLNRLTGRGLISYWDIGNKLSYSGSGTTVEDLVKTSPNNLSVVGSPTYSANNWGNFILNGSSQYMQAVSNVTITSGCTIGVLFKSPSSNPANNKALICVYGGCSFGTSDAFVIYFLSTGAIAGYCRDNSGTNTGVFSSTSTAYADGNFHTAQLVKNGTSSFTLYIDGLPVSTSSTTLGSFNAPPLYVGNNSTCNTTSYYNASISTAFLYNVALTQQEITINNNYLVKRTLH